MAGFKLSINVEPRDIPSLDDAHKRDCADAITGSVNSTLKYTLIMSGAIMALFAAYSFFSFIWMFRMGNMLPGVSAFVPIAATAIFLFEFISGTMKGWALGLQIVFHLVLIAASIMSYSTLVVIPFAAYGAILHFKLVTLLPWHRVISEQPGYPEFTPLPEKMKPPADKKDEDKAAPEEVKKPDDTSASGEVPETTEKPDSTEVPEDTKKSETVPEAVKEQVDTKTSESTEKQEDTIKPEDAEGSADTNAPESPEDQGDIDKSGSTENQAAQNRSSSGKSSKKKKKRKKK
ncbi:MAG: hypothetical protein J1E40_02315 [Oscillospiraceae bacterium]|nr:hypothetical protein [Oscillospiraceae bacterium]